MNEQFRISQRPTPRKEEQQANPTGSARQGDYRVAPRGDGELAGLVQGLAALSPALRRYQDQQDEVDKKAFADDATAAAQKVAVPTEALTGTPVAVPDSVPQAFAPDWRRHFYDALANRQGINNKTAAYDEYNERKGDPDFDVGAWLQEKRAGALAGVTDKRAISVIGAHFSELEGQIAYARNQEQQAQRDEVQKNTFQQIVFDMASADKTPDELFTSFQQAQGIGQGLGFTKADVSQAFLTTVIAASEEAGGAPEMFDVFERKDADGISMAATSPAVAARIREARNVAATQRNKAVAEAADAKNVRALMGYEHDLEKNPSAVTPQRILSDYGKYGVFGSPEAAASMYAKALNAQGRAGATAAIEANFDAGTLFLLKPGQQQDVLTSRLAPVMSAMVEAAKNGDEDLATMVGQQLFKVHSVSGASVPFEQVERWVKTNVSNLPNTKEPSGAFKTAAALYRVLGANPSYRSMYFDEETSALMSAYTDAVAGGTPQQTAYEQAYTGQSKEAKAAAQAYVQTPEFKAIKDKEAKKWVEGASFWRRWLPFTDAGEASNDRMIGAELSSEMVAWRTRNPYASDKQANEHAEGWTRRNFALDISTGLAVKVPESLGGPATQEAITSFSRRMAEEAKLSSRNDGKWAVMFLPQGDEGVYSVVASQDGQPRRNFGRVTIGDLMTMHAATKQLSAAEAKQFGEARMAGTVKDLPQKLLSKVTGLGILNAAEDSSIKVANNAKAIEALRTLPRLTFGEPSQESLQFLRNKPVKIDNKLTARVAQEFWQSGASSDPYIAQAASLITMGEGVSLRAYEDPASGAGKNIGMGYNLKANAKNVHSDLKRAGVPAEAIEGVINGTVDLTPQQAKNLLTVALPRYTQLVVKAANDVDPGLWQRMTPTQKAAMTDVAWQMGDPGAFTKAWKSLNAGDTDAFAAQTKVYYTNKQGVKVEDKRRNGLRASILAGFNYWEETMSKYGSFPSSKLDK